MLRPRDIIAVSVMDRVCPRSVRAGVMRAAVVDPEGLGSGGSAGRMDMEKSAPAESRTREEGKNRREVIVLRCSLEVFLIVEDPGLAG